MAIRAIGSRVLVSTKGSVVDAYGALEGVLVSVGDEVYAPLKVGDVVLFHPYAGLSVMVNGENLEFLKEDDILGVVETE